MRHGQSQLRRQVTTSGGWSLAVDARCTPSVPPPGVWLRPATEQLLVGLDGLRLEASATEGLAVRHAEALAKFWRHPVDSGRST
jgi:hypothetical protein